MSTPATARGEPLRVFLLRLVLLGAVFCGLLASAPLWHSDRPFPRVPVFEGFPVCSGWADQVLFWGMLGALLCSVRFPKAGTGLFLTGALFLYLGDQNRGQPWFYLYCVMLGLLLFSTPSALAANRLVISGVYLWAGIQKCGPQFQELVVPYMVQPVSTHWPGMQTVAEAGLRATPVIEIVLAVALWISATRRVAIGAVIVLHGVVLLLLGPLGHDYNFIVWPWNLAMAACVCLLFHRVKFGEELQTLRRSLGATVVTCLVLGLPGLSYFGWWDSYFSFALYSGNTAKADLFLVPSLVERLPEPMRRFAHPLHQSVVEANPGLGGLLVFDLQSWAQAEVKVPPSPEPRVFRGMGRAVARHAEQPTDVQMIIQPRRGEPVLLRADQLR